MGNSSDPYPEWLGVKDVERPPNHYALLGLPLFEADPEAIGMASMLQMSRVLRHEGDAAAEMIQRLCHELQVATDCLSDPQHKSRYDEELQARQGPSAPGGPEHAASHDSVSFDLGQSEPAGLEHAFDGPSEEEEPPKPPSDDADSLVQSDDGASLTWGSPTRWGSIASWLTSTAIGRRTPSNPNGLLKPTIQRPNRSPNRLDRWRQARRPSPR